MEEYLRLKKRQTARRIVEGAVTLLSLTALILFCALREKSKVVTVIDVTPFFSYDSVRYTKNYTVAMIVFALIFSFSFSFLLADFLRARVYHAVIDGEDVIVYCGLRGIRLLVDGEEKDTMFFKRYLETKLKSGVTIVVSPQFYASYHITFSDNRPPMNL